MSWLDVSVRLSGDGKVQKILSPVSLYKPEDLKKQRTMMVKENFSEGDLVLKRPRREFNDLSMIERMAIDQMSFAVYQPNDGDSLAGDEVNSWRSNAVRPVVRNKIISINAHVTARTIYPKIHAYNSEAVEEKDASVVMGDLMELTVTGNNSAYADVSVESTTSALVNPISWTQTQYQTVMRRVKSNEKDAETGVYKTKLIVDEDNSGFVDEAVPPDQMYFGEFYIRGGNVQLQPWVIRRRIMNYSSAAELFSKYPDWGYVKPGIQTIFSDANNQFYEAYDADMRQNEVEVVYYWNKALDLYLICVNGIMITDADNPNPREDKLYPFTTFGYELLRPQGDCMAYKSLAFKTMPDDKAVNTLYPMIIDASYLALFPPTFVAGVETIGSDVMIPGVTTTASSPDATITPILTNNQNLKAGYDALFEVMKSIDESSTDNQESKKQDSNGPATAYQIQKDDQHAKILLGSFLHMVGRYVKQMGRLRIGDIKQYLTLPELQTLEGSDQSQLVYKTFSMAEGRGRTRGRKIQFDLGLPTGNISKAEHLDHSRETLEQQGGHKSPYQLYRVNPELFRELTYMLFVTPDVIAPLSDEYEAQLGLEEYDRMIQSPQIFDPEETGRILLESYKLTKKDPDKYLAKNPQMGAPNMPIPGMPQGGQQSNPQKPALPAMP